MNSRPLTPPCVPFGTRRFNRMNAEAKLSLMPSATTNGAPYMIYTEPVLFLNYFVNNPGRKVES